MYVTRVFTLEELTKGFFKSEEIIFIPKKKKYYMPGSEMMFFSQQTLKTLLGDISIQFFDEYNGFGAPFILWFSGKEIKEHYMSAAISFWKHSKGTKRSYKLTAEFKKNYFCESTNKKIRLKFQDITLDGVRLCDLDDNREHVIPKSDDAAGYGREYYLRDFVGEMISTMRPEIKVPDYFNEDIEIRKAAREEGTKLEKRWNDGLKNLAVTYAGFSVSKEFRKSVGT